MLNKLGIIIMATLSIMPLNATSSCNFCSDEVIDRQCIYENEHARAFIDYKPVIDGHTLVMPKRHVERIEDLSNDEILSLHDAINQVRLTANKVQGATGFDLFLKNGKEAGQTVPHAHFHIYPRKENDYTDFGIYARMLINRMRDPLSPEALNQKKELWVQNMPSKCPDQAVNY